MYGSSSVEVDSPDDLCEEAGSDESFGVAPWPEETCLDVPLSGTSVVLDLDLPGWTPEEFEVPDWPWADVDADRSLARRRVFSAFTVASPSPTGGTTNVSASDCALNTK